MLPISGNLRDQSVDLYLNTWGVDAEGGQVVTATTKVAGVACSVFPGDPELQQDGETGLWKQVTVWTFHFSADPGTKKLDQVQWVDSASAHNVTVQGPVNRSGRGASYVVKGVEVV